MRQIKYVYLLTSGDGSDGYEWNVNAIYSTREAAVEAKNDNPGTEIEKWVIEDRYLRQDFR